MQNDNQTSQTVVPTESNDTGLPKEIYTILSKAKSTIVKSIEEKMFTGIDLNVVKNYKVPFVREEHSITSFITKRLSSYNLGCEHSYYAYLSHYNCFEMRSDESDKIVIGLSRYEGSTTIKELNNLPIEVLLGIYDYICDKQS